MLSIHVRVNPVVRDVLHLVKGKKTWGEFLDKISEAKSLLMSDNGSKKVLTLEQSIEMIPPYPDPSPLFTILEVEDADTYGSAMGNFWKHVENAKLKQIDLNIPLSEKEFKKIDHFRKIWARHWRTGLKLKSQIRPGSWPDFFTELAHNVNDISICVLVAHRYPKLGLEKAIIKGVLNTRRSILFDKIESWEEIMSWGAMHPDFLGSIKTRFSWIDRWLQEKLESLLNDYETIFELNSEQVLDDYITQKVEIFGQDFDPETGKLDFDSGEVARSLAAFARRTLKKGSEWGKELEEKWQGISTEFKKRVSIVMKQIKEIERNPPEPKAVQPQGSEEHLKSPRRRNR